LRDAPALVVDYYSYPLAYVSHDLTRWELSGVYYIDQRSYLLYAEEAIGTEFFDPYAVLRDAYLERRAILIADGEGIGDEDDDDEMIRELEELED
jgi:phospholipid-binding lipoprotein MlaA